jgi:hypothetical protein
MWLVKVGVNVAVSGNVAVSEGGALECASGDVIEEKSNIGSAIELHQSGVIACLARNQEIATQTYEVGRPPPLSAAFRKNGLQFHDRSTTELLNVRGRTTT